MFATPTRSTKRPSLHPPTPTSPLPSHVSPPSSPFCLEDPDKRTPPRDGERAKVSALLGGGYGLGGAWSRPGPGPGPGRRRLLRPPARFCPRGAWTNPGAQSVPESQLTFCRLHGRFVEVKPATEKLLLYRLVRSGSPSTRLPLLGGHVSIRPSGSSAFLQYEEQTSKR